MIKKIVIGLVFGVLLLTIILINKQLKSGLALENLSPISKIRENSEQKTGIINFGKETEIILTGDIMLGRSVMATSLLRKNVNYPFEKVAKILKSADITAGNLENPITKDCPISNDGFKFCTSPEMAEGLIFAGVDVVSLANNHTTNYGNDGFIQTKNYLKNENVDFVGDKNLVIKEVNGIKFGFLGMDFVVNKPTEIDYEFIKESKKNVDVLIVMLHWGVEYTSSPTATQKLIAKKIIESGADVIAGGHPHWPQDIEYIEGKPVFYSLGNFVFDQSWSEETKKGLVVKLRYQGNKLLGVDKMPIYMKNFGQPEWTGN